MKEYILFHTISLTASVILDRIVGDPHALPHPVRAVGGLIAYLDKKLLGDSDTVLARDGKKERRLGVLLWFTVIPAAALIMSLIIILSYKLNKYFGIVIETIAGCYILAAGSLYRESMAVYKELKKGDIPAARKAVSMIVGRDTDKLDEEGVTKAAVETVAENTSDGVIAPLIYLALGGPILGMVYKAVNTLDSMVGYKNRRYADFGAFSAHADDIWNIIPSRISALLMIVSCFFAGIFSKRYNAGRALKIWLRDRYNHSSPNSAQTESVCAGALGLKLGGPHPYKGVLVEKPYIGDEIRKAETEDIKRANTLMLMTEDTAAIIILTILMIMILI